MTKNFRHYVGALAITAGLAFGVSAVQAAGAPFDDHDSNHEPDYSKNKRYNLGMREGRDDHAHNRDHYKKRHFAKDEDQKAYESGYQKGHGN